MSGYKTHDTITLDNGLRIITVPTNGLDSTYIELLGSAGAQFETPEQIGVAHFLEHILFDGTTKYPTSQQLNDLIENVGGRSNGSTGRVGVSYYARLLKDDLPKGFEYLSQMMMHSLIRDEDIAREKTIIEQEIARMKDNPSRYLRLKRRMNLFEESRYKQFVSGEVADIEKITAKALRSYLTTHYHAGNFTLGLATDLSPDEVRELGEQYFSALPAGSKNKLDTPTWDNSQHMYTEHRSDIKQTTFFLNFPSFSRFDPRVPALKVLGSILGGGMSSRLFQLIREEKGYVYSIAAGNMTALNYGSFYVFAGLGEQNLNETLSLIKQELHRISTELVSPAEFNRVKKTVEAAFVFGLESPVAQVNYYNELEHFNLPFKNHHEDLARYERVTPKEVQQVAKEIFSTQPKLSMLTPTDTKDQITWPW